MTKLQKVKKGKCQCNTLECLGYEWEKIHFVCNNPECKKEHFITKQENIYESST